MTIEAWDISAEGKDLLEAILRLPQRDREILADRLNASIDTSLPDPAWQNSWSAELDRRDAEMDNGEVHSMSLDEVRRMMHDARHGKMGS